MIANLGWILLVVAAIAAVVLVVRSRRKGTTAGAPAPTASSLLKAFEAHAASVESLVATRFDQAISHTNAAFKVVDSKITKLATAAAPAAAALPEPAAPASPVASVPPPVEAAPAAPVASGPVAAPTPVPVALADSYPSRHDLVAAAAAIKTVYAITVDGAQVWPGFGPPDEFFTQPNGGVSKIRPTPAVMAPVGSSGALAESYPNAAALEAAVAALRFTGAVQLDGKIIHAGFGKADGAPWAYATQPDGSVKAA